MNSARNRGVALIIGSNRKRFGKGGLLVVVGVVVVVGYTCVHIS